MNEFKEWLSEGAFMVGCILMMLIIVWFVMVYLVPLAVETGVFIGAKL